MSNRHRADGFGAAFWLGGVISVAVSVGVVIVLVRTVIEVVQWLTAK